MTKYIPFLFSLALIIFIFFILVLNLENFSNSPKNFFSFGKNFFDFSNFEKNLGKKTGKKLILAWTNYYRGPWENFLEIYCPELESICEWSTNRRLVAKSDVLLFSKEDLNWNEFQIPPKEKRKKWQIFLLFSHEPPNAPYNPVNLNEIPGFFNWTMSSRSDSDVPFPFGNFKPKNQTAKNFFNWTALEVEISSKYCAIISNTVLLFNYSFMI